MKTSGVNMVMVRGVVRRISSVYSMNVDRELVAPDTRWEER